MGIKITPVFTQAELEKELKKELEKVWRITLNELISLGAGFVTQARDKEPNEAYKKAVNELSWSRSAPRATLGPDSPGFNDQTGNLRSSIGFMIFYDGKEVHANFEGDQAEGRAKGTLFAQQTGATESIGWALITVAGMEYASWVEALGYDVITGSTIGAQSKFDDIWRNISKALNQRRN